MKLSQRLVESILGKKDFSTAENRTLRISTILYFQAIIVSLIFLPFHYLLGGPFLLLSSALVGVTAIFSLIFMHMGHTTLSKLTFITLSNLAVFLNARLATMESNIQFFLWVTISLPFFMFTTQKNKKSIYFSVLFPIFLVLILVLNPNPLIAPLDINQTILPWYATLSILASMSMLAFTIYYFHSNVEKREAEIIVKNELIFQNEKMVSLGVLASGIAHEINNPLAVVKMGIDVLKKQNKAESLDQEYLGEKLQKIDLNVIRIGKIVSSLKTYSRNEDIDPLSKVDVNKVIDEAITLLTKEFSLADINISLPESSTTVLAREGELIQIMVNLFLNAIDESKKMPDEKWIKISTAVKDDKLEIAIQDAGLGIPKDVEQKIFQPFYTTKMIGEGTGLGLYICRNLVESMGGEIHYELRDKHTTFVITLKRF